MRKRSPVWRCFAGPSPDKKNVKQLWCRISKTEDGKLCRLPLVDKDHLNEACGARYPLLKKDKNEKTTTASFGKHLENEHVGWEQMLEEEDALAAQNSASGSSGPSGTILSCFFPTDEHTKRRKKQVRRTVICTDILFSLNLYPLPQDGIKKILKMFISNNTAFRCIENAPTKEVLQDAYPDIKIPDLRGSSKSSPA
jgi:hypothetical protein